MYNKNWWNYLFQINFDANIENDDNFKSFKYKAKLIGSTAALNGVLENIAITVPLKYLSNFWIIWNFILTTGGHENNVMLILIILFLVSKTQDYMIMLSLYQ